MSKLCEYGPWILTRKTATTIPKRRIWSWPTNVFAKHKEEENKSSFCFFMYDHRNLNPTQGHGYGPGAEFTNNFIQIFNDFRSF